ncbi:Uncharacterised protein [Chlamydia abortus]|nr:Uncharacterised protein [Chlamydia abortus]
MKTIHIRTNYQRAQEPFPEGRLLFDERHAIYVADGGVFMVPVVPLDYDGLYGQDGDNIGLGRVRNNDPAVIDEVFCCSWA